MRARQIWFLGPFLVPVRERRQLPLVGAPSHFRGGRALLAEALDAPGVDEFVHLLRLVGDLRVALAAVDDLDAELPREVVELPPGDQVRDLLGRPALDLPVGDQRFRRCRSGPAS